MLEGVFRLFDGFLLSLEALLFPLNRLLDCLAGKGSTLLDAEKYAKALLFDVFLNDGWTLVSGHPSGAPSACLIHFIIPGDLYR